MTADVKGQDSQPDRNASLAGNAEELGDAEPLVHQCTSFEAEALAKSAEEFSVPSPLLQRTREMGHPDQT